MGNRLHRLRRRLLILERFPRINNLFIDISAAMDADAYAILTTPLSDIEFDESIGKIMDFDVHTAPSHPYAVDINLDVDLQTGLFAVNPHTSSLPLIIDDAVIDVMTINATNPLSTRIQISKDIIEGIARISAKVNNSSSTSLLFSERDIAKIYLATTSVSTSQIAAGNIKFTGDVLSNVVHTKSYPLDISTSMVADMQCSELDSVTPITIPQWNIKCDYTDDISANMNVIHLSSLKTAPLTGTVLLDTQITSIPMNEIETNINIGDLNTNIAVKLAQRSKLNDYDDHLLIDLAEYTLYDMRYFTLTGTQGNTTMTSIASKTLQQLQYI